MRAIAALCVMTTVVVPSSRVDARERLEHDDAGGDVERAGRLVAEQHRRPLGDRARDGDALLLAAGELRRKVIEPVAAGSTSASASSGGIGASDDLGDQRDVLARRQAGNQVVELEDEADVPAAVGGERRLVGVGQVAVVDRRPGRSSARRARRGC